MWALIAFVLHGVFLLGKSEDLPSKVPDKLLNKSLIDILNYNFNVNDVMGIFEKIFKNSVDDFKIEEENNEMKNLQFKKYNFDKQNYHFTYPSFKDYCLNEVANSENCKKYADKDYIASVFKDIDSKFHSRFYKEINQLKHYIFEIGKLLKRRDELNNEINATFEGIKNTKGWVNKTMTKKAGTALPLIRYFEEMSYNLKHANKSLSYYDMMVQYGNELNAIIKNALVEYVYMYRQTKTYQKKIEKYMERNARILSKMHKKIILSIFYMISDMNKTNEKIDNLINKKVNEFNEWVNYENANYVKKLKKLKSNIDFNLDDINEHIDLSKEKLEQNKIAFINMSKYLTFQNPTKTIRSIMHLLNNKYPKDVNIVFLYNEEYIDFSLDKMIEVPQPCKMNVDSKSTDDFNFAHLDFMETSKYEQMLSTTTFEQNDFKHIDKQKIDNIISEIFHQDKKLDSEYWIKEKEFEDVKSKISFSDLNNEIQVYTDEMEKSITSTKEHYVFKPTIKRYISSVRNLFKNPIFYFNKYIYSFQKNFDSPVTTHNLESDDEKGTNSALEDGPFSELARELENEIDTELDTELETELADAELEAHLETEPESEVEPEFERNVGIKSWGEQGKEDAFANDKEVMLVNKKDDKGEMGDEENVEEASWEYAGRRERERQRRGAQENEIDKGEGEEEDKEEDKVESKEEDKEEDKGEGKEEDKEDDKEDHKEDGREDPQEEDAVKHKKHRKAKKKKENKEDDGEDEEEEESEEEDEDDDDEEGEDEDNFDDEHDYTYGNESSGKYDGLMNEKYKHKLSLFRNANVKYLWRIPIINRLYNKCSENKNDCVGKNDIEVIDIYEIEEEELEEIYQDFLNLSYEDSLKKVKEKILYAVPDTEYLAKALKIHKKNREENKERNFFYDALYGNDYLIIKSKGVNVETFIYPYFETLNLQLSEIKTCTLEDYYGCMKSVKLSDRLNEKILFVYLGTFKDEVFKLPKSKIADDLKNAHLKQFLDNPKDYHFFNNFLIKKYEEEYYFFQKLKVYTVYHSKYKNSIMYGIDFNFYVSYFSKEDIQYLPLSYYHDSIIYFKVVLATSKYGYREIVPIDDEIIKFGLMLSLDNKNKNVHYLIHSEVTNDTNYDLLKSKTGVVKIYEVSYENLRMQLVNKKYKVQVTKTMKIILQKEVTFNNNKKRTHDYIDTFYDKMNKIMKNNMNLELFRKTFYVHLQNT
ncbi:hypothetical protein PVBG_05026 [Plasmodium vivax Brazil I]|uniref:Rhoptry protein n=1 Tax=Plasmodium vivax (strain Brazil I) TaxID=1033975 RepID=A0A0J9SUC3_PLAV1|nr:hypothetical protein PVBG_05026 [Plasmodium vivax Brazil I]